MIELLFSRSKCAMVDTNGNLKDISVNMENEIHFYNLFADVVKDNDLIIDDPIEPEQIYFHIVEKAYLCGETHKENHTLHRYDYDLTETVKHKLLSAFTIYFKSVCENKMGNRIELGNI